MRWSPVGEVAEGPLGGHGGPRRRGRARGELGAAGEPCPRPPVSSPCPPGVPRPGEGWGRALAARPHVCSPCGFIREKEEDERGGREERGAPSAFPGFQGSLEPLNEIIGRNGVWRERSWLAPLGDRTERRSSPVGAGEARSGAGHRGWGGRGGRGSPLSRSASSLPSFLCRQVRFSNKDPNKRVEVNLAGALCGPCSDNKRNKTTYLQRPAALPPRRAPTQRRRRPHNGRGLTLRRPRPPSRGSLPRFVFCRAGIWGTRVRTGHPPSSEAGGKGLALCVPRPERSRARGTVGRRAQPLPGLRAANSASRRRQAAGRHGRGAARDPAGGSAFTGTPRPRRPGLDGASGAHAGPRAAQRPLRPEGHWQRGVEAAGGRGETVPAPLPPWLLPAPSQHQLKKKKQNQKNQKKPPRSNNAVYPLPPKGVCDLLLEGELQRLPSGCLGRLRARLPRRAVPAAPSPRPVSCKTRGRDLSSVAEPPRADWPGRTHLFPDKPPSHGWLSINLFKKVSGVVKAERESACVCKRG
ncbi:collagen alpha-1(I) chain-like [Aquila chrysaetos chrysaetos]|uniref:collagen alpha-1(I) chain-like n=1 Tax=Aquila chrysaetos chrysaetos TaxID=223781 RepID=UPI001176DEB5|nr:collagen alpha-1(I) chain-like [Aquila chrysaetos chrysaetos]